jgi:hypothetical protein
MTDEFEDLLKRWLRERAGADRSALQALAGNIAVLPPRRRRRGSQLATAAVILVAFGLAAFALMPRFGSVSAPAGPAPPDPAAFAGDPRLARCGATAASALDVFEMTHARDYRLYLPAMGLSPELDVADPGFVVVYRALQPFGVGGAAPPSGQTWAPRSAVPGRHDVCVLVGADPPTAEMNIYADVDITGLTLDVSSSEPPPTPTPSFEPTTAGTTPEPAPAWAGDASLSLQCSGPPSTIGPTGSLGGGPSDSANTAVMAYLEDDKNAMGVFPLTGFEEADSAPGARLYVYRVNGGVRAAIVVNGQGGREDGPWSVGSAASCDAAEFDPATPIGGGVVIWTGASGERVRTSILFEHADCYQGTTLRLAGRLYVRDPSGSAYDPASMEMTYDGHATLPKTAIRQPYSNGNRRLFLAADGRAVYLVSPATVERWPHIKGDEILRTDCN